MPLRKEYNIPFTYSFSLQFFEEASECEQWMSRQSDSISSRYTDENQSIDTLNQLLKELQELSAQIADYERQVSSLTIRSREIIPLKQRGQPVFSELRCRCLCIYKQPPVSVHIFYFNKWSVVVTLKCKRLEFYLRFF